ncbi:RagB/SusD family nutrient uptake outer membrane protein [Puteibacter caeruleilacunae]|nr:RagB/SusD family nutrient uptake outer membrane protein [Puteibacter caeruleilacunae]
MKVKNILLAFSFLVFFACENVLEENPKSFISPAEYFNTEAEVEAAVFGVYNFFHTASIAESDWMFLGDFGTDVSITRNLAKMAYQYAEMETISNQYSSMWRVYYKAIGAANLVISRVEDSDSLSDSFKKKTVAEVKFMRGYFYHHLNLVWGNVPVWLDELNLDEVEVLGTTAADEVRNQVISDLKAAAEGLPTSVSQAGRVTQWAAKGLLARVYLLGNQWQEAKVLAQDVIDNSGHSLLNSYYDVFDWTNKMNSELIHVVPKAADIKASTLHSFSSPRPFDDNKNFQIPEGESVIRPDGQLSTDKKSRNPGSLFQGWGMYQTIKENYDSFEEGDSRRELWWSELKFTDGTSFKLTGGGSAGLPGRSGYYNLKWIAWDEAPNNGGRDIHLQRLAELYLIYAEAENELNGPTADAYEAINTVRRRAFGDNNHDLAGLNKEEFRQAIINENRWELGGEGLRRWYLWHWGYETFKKASEFAKESNPKLFQNLKEHHKWFGIPEEEIVKNPNLQQNPGY